MTEPGPEGSPLAPASSGNERVRVERVQAQNSTVSGGERR
jgi:hypothetical protein